MIACTMCGGVGHRVGDCPWKKPTAEQTRAFGEALAKGEIGRYEDIRFISSALVGKDMFANMTQTRAAEPPAPEPRRVPRVPLESDGRQWRPTAHVFPWAVGRA